MISFLDLGMIKFAMSAYNRSYLKLSTALIAAILSAKKKRFAMSQMRGPSMFGTNNFGAKL